MSFLPLPCVHPLRDCVSSLWRQAWGTATVDVKSKTDLVLFPFCGKLAVLE